MDTVTLDFQPPDRRLYISVLKAPPTQSLPPVYGISLQQPYHADQTSVTVLVQMSVLQAPGLSPLGKHTHPLQDAAGPAFPRWFWVRGGGPWSGGEESGGPESPFSRVLCEWETVESGLGCSQM